MISNSDIQELIENAIINRDLRVIRKLVEMDINLNGYILLTYRGFVHRNVRFYTVNVLNKKNKGKTFNIFGIFASALSTLSKKSSSKTP